MGEIVEATTSTFVSLVNDSRVVIVDFHADWCRACQTMSMIFKKLIAQENIKIVKVNVDACPAISDKFQVQNLPTLLFIKNNKVVLKQEGVMNEAAIRKTLKSLVDPIIISYLHDMIEQSEEITEELLQTIQAYMPENISVTIKDLQEIKELLLQSHFQTETVDIVNQDDSTIQINYAIKEDKDYKDKLLEEHPYLDRQKLLFLIHKHGKKQLEQILIVKESENENWFDENMIEYQRFCKQQEQNQRKEKEVKKSLYEKYYSSIIDPTKTYRPLVIQSKEKQTRYHNNKVVTNKGEKFVFENTTSEYDGGSRGRVKTKGKRGQGWV